MIEKPTIKGAPIHQSLVNPILLAGMERGPAITIFIAAAALIAARIEWYTVLLAAVLLTVVPYGLRQLADYDPQFEMIVKRYMAYQPVYEAESTANRRTARVLAGPQRPAVPTPKEIS